MTPPFTLSFTTAPFTHPARAPTVADSVTDACPARVNGEVRDEGGEELCEARHVAGWLALPYLLKRPLCVVPQVVIVFSAYTWFVVYTRKSFARCLCPLPILGSDRLFYIHLLRYRPAGPSPDIFARCPSRVPSFLHTHTSYIDTALLADIICCSYCHSQRCGLVFW